MSVQALVTSAVPLLMAWSTYSDLGRRVRALDLVHAARRVAGLEHLADQPDTRYRWSGSDHDSPARTCGRRATKSLA